MFAGLDYGTSHCAIGVHTTTGVQLVPLDGDTPFMQSNILIAARELLVQAVADLIQDPNQQSKFCRARARDLQRAQRIKNELGLTATDAFWSTGQAATKLHLQDPLEGWFAKSPKSFLGASGISDAQRTFLTDIVTVMLLHMKQRLEQHQQTKVEQVVIGRPINFQGINAESSNAQAVSILQTAAELAGFKDIAFFYEPIGAGLDFETQLCTDQKVLVVDAGGGTTDCSLIQMGPSHRNQIDRSADFLGHSGMRIGGNDLDIRLIFHHYMNYFGKNSQLKDGLPVPVHLFGIASQVNNIPAQAEFYSAASNTKMQFLTANIQDTQSLKRFETIRENLLTYRLWQSAEQCKLALSNGNLHHNDLGYIETGLSTELNANEYEQLVAPEVQRIERTILEPIRQSATKPDMIYLTGGTSKLSLLRTTVQVRFPDTPIVEGDHFGSVTAGLTKIAKRVFG